MPDSLVIIDEINELGQLFHPPTRLYGRSIVDELTRINYFGCKIKVYASILAIEALHCPFGPRNEGDATLLSAPSRFNLLAIIALTNSAGAVMEMEGVCCGSDPIPALLHKRRC